MKIEEFKREVDGMFPCKWAEDFLKDTQKTFDKYIGIVSCLEGIDTNVLDNIKHLCDSLIDVVNLYYDGRKGEAFMMFSTIMNGDRDTEGLFASIGSVDVNPDKVGVNIACKYDMMGHFNEKGYAATCIDGKWGVIDINDNVHAPFIYDRAYNPGYNSAVGLEHNSSCCIVQI